jgi:hypothetical protein
MELQRALFQAHLDVRAAKEQEVEVEGADGMARTQMRESERTLETVFGEVTVKRRLYQAPGVEGLAPMDAALNLPSEHYSHGIRRFVAEECARSSFDEVVEVALTAGISEAKAYAIRKTGIMIVDGLNDHLFSEDDKAAWEAAIDEFEAMS